MTKDTRVQDGKTLELVNLLDPTLNMIHEEIPADARTLPDGEFAHAAFTVNEQGRTVLVAARTIRVPARIAWKHVSTKHIRFFAAHRISEIRDAWLANLPARTRDHTLFSPLYTKMVPAFSRVTVDPEQLGEWTYDWFLPGPMHASYPERECLPADADIIGEQLIRRLSEVISFQLDFIPHEAPIGVGFSGGADSTAVLATLLETLSTKRRANPVIAYTLAIDGGGSDAAQARAIAKLLHKRYGDQSFRFVPVEVASSTIRLSELQERSAMMLEEYHIRDVECGMAGLLLDDAVRRMQERGEIPKIRYVFNGEGGNEGFGDYLLDQVTLEDVVSDPHLYFCGRDRKKYVGNEVFSGGLSRAYPRTFNLARAAGVIPCSPFIDRGAIDLVQRIPFRLLVHTPADLYALRPKVVRLGIRRVSGLDLPAFPKARFQEGCAADPKLLRITQKDSLRLRQIVLHP